MEHMYVYLWITATLMVLLFTPGASSASACLVLVHLLRLTCWLTAATLWITFTGSRNNKGPHKRASEGLAGVTAPLTCGSGDIAALRPF